MSLADLEPLGLTPKTYQAGTPPLAYSEGPANGPKLVLVHGLSGRRDSFIKVLPELTQHFHVFALDQRGHGQSGRQTPNYALADYAGDLSAFLRNVTGPGAIVWGQSLGAAVTLYLLSEQPDLAGGVILEDPPLTKAPPSTKPSVFDFWLSLAESDLSEAEISHALAARGDLSPFQVIYKSETLFQLDPAVLRCALAGQVTAIDLGPALLSLPMPTLLIQGDPKAGGILPDAVLESLRPLPANIRHYSMPGIGHKPHDQAPERTCELVLEWYRSAF
ncbi:MAG: alpha/beta hydrolase [Polyangiaceae bacterium]|nr:alpha/beta hydrolase [Polyangiaceae bacterium]